jgi:hypothetical protein
VEGSGASLAEVLSWSMSVKARKFCIAADNSKQTLVKYNSEALPLVRRFVPCDQLSNVTNGSYLWCQRSSRARDFYLFCITCSKQRPTASVLLWQVTRCYSACRTEAPVRIVARSLYEPWYARPHAAHNKTSEINSKATEKETSTDGGIA